MTFVRVSSKRRWLSMNGGTDGQEILLLRRCASREAVARDVELAGSLASFPCMCNVYSNKQYEGNMSLTVYTSIQFKSVEGTST